MFSIIKTKENVENFLDKTNALHDGYIIGVQYTNGGITKLEYGHHFNPEQTKLIIQVFGIVLLKLNLKTFWNGRLKTGSGVLLIQVLYLMKMVRLYGWMMYIQLPKK